MHLLIQCLCVFILTASLRAEEIFVPEPFREGEVIEQIILISDVDGVVRESVEAVADPRVISAVKALLLNPQIDVAFISGTPIANDDSLETWRRGNIPLSRVFGSAFESELSQNRVAVYGTLGGHRMKSDGSLEVLDEYSLETSFELSRQLLHAFLKEVVEHGSPEQGSLAASLRCELDFLELRNRDQATNATAEEFGSIVNAIREHFDPGLRLINNGSLVETHTSHPLWKTGLFFEWLRSEIDQPEYVTSQLAPFEKQMAAGVAKRGDQGLNYLLISKTNKGITTKKHIEEKMRQYPHALIVTIGDTQVDFPMHRNAHLAFHVGMEKVWQNNPLPQCMLVRNSQGEDRQHIEGTLKVLELLQEAVGKSFYDLKYIPKMDSSGQWDYYSIRELQRNLPVN